MGQVGWPGELVAEPKPEKKKVKKPSIALKRVMGQRKKIFTRGVKSDRMKIKLVKDKAAESFKVKVEGKTSSSLSQAAPNNSLHPTCYPSDFQPRFADSVGLK